MRNYDYACTAAVHEGVARCRNLVPRDAEGFRCTIHPEAANAPAPDVILVKFNLNERNLKRCREAGIFVEERRMERSIVLGERRVAQATSLGRSADIRPEDRDQSPRPESHDSGTPVFGPEGLTAGTWTADILCELMNNGFDLTRLSILTWKTGRKPARLSLEFSREKKPGAVKADNPQFALVLDLLTTCFKRVDVWANPRDPQKENRIVHTVNCGERQDVSATPVYQLQFAKGNWEVESFQKGT